MRENHRLFVDNRTGAKGMRQFDQRVRPRAIIRLAIVISLSIATLAFGPLLKSHALRALRAVIEDQAAPIVPSDNEFAAIAAAAIEHARFEGVPPAPEDATCSTPDLCRRSVAISDRSIVVCPGSSSDANTRACPSLIFDDSLVSSRADYSIPRQLRLQLAEANRRPKRIPDVTVAYAQMVRQEDIDAIFETQQGLGWSAFYRRFENSAGYVRTSIPVLSADGTWAAIILEHGCGDLCGVGLLYLLMRDPQGQWHVVVEDMLWIS